MSLYRTNTFESGCPCLILMAFAIAVEQHILEQFGHSGALEPTHWMMTMFPPLTSPFASSRPRSVCLITRGFFPYRVAVGAYSTAPVATIMTPCLTVSPLLRVVSKLPICPLTSETSSPRWSLTLSEERRQSLSRFIVPWGSTPERVW